MIDRVIALDGPPAGQSFEWIDVIDPTADELQRIAEAYELHSTSVKDCLEPEHFPKHEQFEDVSFFILRAHDSMCAAGSDTVQELTRKIAFFTGPRFLITIHRVEQPFLRVMKERWRQKAKDGKAYSIAHAVNELMRAVVASYEEPLESCQFRLEALETQTFRPETPRFSAEDAYLLIRETSVYKRMLRACLDVFDKLDALPDVSLPFFQDLREDAEHLYADAADLVENVNRILQLQLAIVAQRTNEASARTNEVMRVLTVVSLFFMPLNLIAGIYGMNFEFMPELRHAAAYPTVLAVMVAITVANYLWFRRKGWVTTKRRP